MTGEIASLIEETYEKFNSYERLGSTRVHIHSDRLIISKISFICAAPRDRTALTDARSHIRKTVTGTAGSFHPRFTSPRKKDNYFL